MRQDALDALNMKGPKKVPHKETVNNYELFLNTSGIDPYENIENAYIKTISKLGIDYIAGVPRTKDIIRIEKGETRTEKRGRKTFGLSYLGVFPTGFTMDYGFRDTGEVFAYDPEVEDSIDYENITVNYKDKYDENSRMAGENALIYPWYYYTLFMGPLETFGWELFMEAAMEDEEKFDELLEKFKRQSVKHISAMNEIGTDFIMVHDDICISTGPVFNPKWYEKYIYPRYKEMFAPIKAQGKKIIFTSDGNIDAVLDDLVGCGFDGFMIETPATSFDNCLEKYGKDKVFIGGIDTALLTLGTPNEVFEHTKEIMLKGKQYPGFFISSPGGIHGNIPYANLEAYFSAKEKYGYR